MATKPAQTPRKRLWEHLVKPMLIQPTPAGLYAEPRFWMEGKDLEGFNAHISYGFIKHPGPIHPLKGALVHPFDELLIFAGIDNTNIRYLGAEASVELGEEREVQMFDKPTVVLVPKGTPHGPITVNKLERPIVHYTIGLAPAYSASVAAGAATPTTGEKYKSLIVPLVNKKSSVNVKDESGMGYEETMGSDGVMRPAENSQVVKLGPGNADELVWLYGGDLGMKVNFTWGFYTKCGKWHRAGEAHTHPEEEVLVFVGLDPDDLNYMGAEIEYGMGAEDERYIFNTPTVFICPKGFPHLPCITRWVDKPYGFFVACLDASHDAPWAENS